MFADRAGSAELRLGLARPAFVLQTRSKMEPPDPAKFDRRKFLQRTLVAAGGAAALAPRLIGAGANDSSAPAVVPIPAPAAPAEDPIATDSKVITAI